VLKKIVIVENTCTHQDFLYTLAVLSIKSGYKVVVFASHQVYEQVLPLIGRYQDEIEWHLHDIKQATISSIDYLLKLRKYVRSQECILIVDSLYCFSEKFLALFALLIRNRGMYLGSGRTALCFEFGKKGSWLRRMIRHVVMQFLLKRFKGLIIHSPDYFAYLNAKRYNRRTLFLPWFLSEGELLTTQRRPGNSEEVCFAVVGSIEEKRRDYLSVLRTFEELWKAGYINFKLDLIGRPIGEYGENVLKLCKVYAQKGYPIVFNETFLPMEQFLQRIEACDCLLAPMNLAYYQRNQSSSVVTEQVRFGKMAIVPSVYQVEELRASTLYYQNIDDVKEIIISNFCDDKNINHLQSEAQVNALKFNFEKYISSFEEFVGDQ